MSTEAMKQALELIRQSKIQGRALERDEMLDEASKLINQAISKLEQRSIAKAEGKVLSSHTDQYWLHEINNALADGYTKGRASCIAEAEKQERETHELFKCNIAPRPLTYSLHNYHTAMSEGPLHHTWTDKPHRLVYDLIAAVKYYTHPQPKRECPQAERAAWVGLTDDQKLSLEIQGSKADVMLAELVEQWLKEMNT